MVDRKVVIRMHVTGGDHIDTLLLQRAACVHKTSHRRVSTFFIDTDLKLSQSEALTSYVPTTRTVEPSDLSRLGAMVLPNTS